MNVKSEMGDIMRTAIIDGDVDDDCQTDDEQQKDAKSMLKNELSLAITRFIQDKKDGTQGQFVKNLNLQKRFARQW